MSERLSRITLIPPDSIHGSKLGLEKEGLRVSREGRISQRRHPPGLGSSLTHPSITTDFSEALLELITPPSPTAQEALANLSDTESFVHRKLDDEIIWAASMPCRIDSDSEIPIACYGRSDDGMTKHIYRRGLSHRYGRMMQTIAGVHFNFSFADELWPTLQEMSGQPGALQPFIADRYMSTLRNLQRYDWLLLYLFGASPATPTGFADASAKLQRFDRETDFAPYATSLRMSDIGYSNRLPAGRSVFIDNNSLPAYIASLHRLVQTPHPPYEAIGIRVDGEQRQLNTHVLQIENEYYTDVRPKQILHADESPLMALQRRGIRYLELRALDVNPFYPSGITLEQLLFLEVFTHFCLLSESPSHDRQQTQANQYNLNKSAYEGRHPAVKLNRDGAPIGLKSWSLELFDAMQPIAELLDRAAGGAAYTTALEQQRECVEQPALTPSARLLTTLRDRRESFVQFALRQSSAHHQHHLARDLLNARWDYFEALSRQSLRQQQQLECKEQCLPGASDHDMGILLCNRSGRRCTAAAAD